MTNKIYGGVFERIYERRHSLGFGAANEKATLGDGEDIRQKIIDKGYFTLEELSRINTILGYDELSRDTKKQILLFSKLSEFVKKRDRYKRQFGIDLKITDEYIDAVLDSLTDKTSGMRSVNNFVKNSIDEAEKAILENERKGYKALILTRDTALNPKKFDIS
jgi:ATP-dependent Clp protease ATP-binding subunit ClpA